MIKDQLAIAIRERLAALGLRSACSGFGTRSNTQIDQAPSKLSLYPETYSLERSHIGIQDRLSSRTEGHR